MVLIEGGPAPSRSSRRAPPWPTRPSCSRIRVAALLHVRDYAVRGLIARGEPKTVDGKVPRWVLLEWQQARIERMRHKRQH